MGEVRNDERRMPHQGQHRVALIDVALAGVPARVSVDVGHNFQTAIPAMGPERGASRGVKRNATALIGIGIEIVVANV